MAQKKEENQQKQTGCKAENALAQAADFFRFSVARSPPLAASRVTFGLVMFGLLAKESLDII